MSGKGHVKFYIFGLYSFFNMFFSPTKWIKWHSVSDTEPEWFKWFGGKTDLFHFFFQFIDLVMLLSGARYPTQSKVCAFNTSQKTEIVIHWIIDLPKWCFESSTLVRCRKEISVLWIFDNFRILIEKKNRKEQDILTFRFFFSFFHLKMLFDTERKYFEFSTYGVNINIYLENWRNKSNAHTRYKTQEAIIIVHYWILLRLLACYDMKPKRVRRCQSLKPFK